MIKVVTVAKMREIEAAANASGLSYDAMMQNAGRAVADRALNIISSLSNPRVTVLVGAGNNGGDGLVAGRFLAQDSDAQVRFYMLTQRDDSDHNYKAVRDAGVFIAYAEDDKDGRVVRNLVSSADLVIDALFGIGIRLPLKGEAARVLRNVNQALNEPLMSIPVTSSVNPTWPGQFRQTPKPYVLAVDCPSGLDCDSGAMDANTIYADETVTFIAAKPGLFLFPGADAVGQVYVAPIHVSTDLEAWRGEAIALVDSEAVRSLLPKRHLNSNKGTYGKVLVIAGSSSYVGAPALAAEAAYRAGAGLVTVGAPEPAVNILAAKLTEPTWLPLPHEMGNISESAAKIVLGEVPKYDVLLLGPGIGKTRYTRTFLTQILDHLKSGQAVRRLVIDADGLNLLSEIEQWWTFVPPQTIITPHPGEMGRLAKMDTSQVQSLRWHIARQKAGEWDITLLLKGAHTLVAAPDGRMAVLPFKTDALAKAGTGDVLAGVIAGLLAQGMSPFEAALVGAYLHGLAGQNAGEWHTTRTVTAGDVLAALGSALEMVESI